MTIASHPVLMDRIYRHQRHIYDITRKSYLLGRDDLIDGLYPPANGTVLEVGCGTGRNLIASARRYPAADHFGFDISSEMLRTARSNIDRAGLDGKVRLATGDAVDFDGAAIFGTDCFDRIFMSYSLSMIPPWREAVENALDQLGIGGELHIVDFGQLERLPVVCKRALSAWLSRFHVTPRVELFEWLDAVSHERGLACRSRSLYRGYAWSAVVSRPRAVQTV